MSAAMADCWSLEPGISACLQCLARRTGDAASCLVPDCEFREMRATGGLKHDYNAIGIYRVLKSVNVKFFPCRDGWRQD